MAYIHQADKGHDLQLCGLALFVVVLIAGAIPFLQFVVNEAFALFD
jgi:hypothetical protein